MNHVQASYIETHYGDLRRFLDVYIPVDEKLRLSLSATDGQSIVDNVVTATNRSIADAFTTMSHRIGELQHSVKEQLSRTSMEELRTFMPSGDSFKRDLREAVVQVFEDRLQSVTQGGRQDFIATLEHYLRCTDNDHLLGRVETIANSCAENRFELGSFQTHIKDLLLEVQKTNTRVESLETPVQAILTEATIHKSKRGSKIGYDSQDKCAVFLTRCFPEHGVEQVSNQGGKADFLLSRASLPDVLIELKDHGSNVKTVDVNRFEKDIRQNCRHGIMLSLRSGVVNRHDFEFRVIDNRYIALYVCRLDWDETKVQGAVRLLYCLEEVLRAADAEGNVAFSPQTFDEINTELSGYESKIREVESILEKAKSLLSTVLLDTLKTKLATGIRIVPKAPPTEKAPAQGGHDPDNVKEGQCAFCGEARPSWKNSSNLTKHVKKCPLNPNRAAEGTSDGGADPPAEGPPSTTVII